MPFLLHNFWKASAMNCFPLSDTMYFKSWGSCFSNALIISSALTRFPCMKRGKPKHFRVQLSIITVRQEVASQIAAMPLPPFGVTLLWHAFSVMKRCEAHKTM